MWPGVVILFVLIALLVFLKTRPKPVPPVPTDSPEIPSPWAPPIIGNDPNVRGGPPLATTASWAGGRRPIRRPSTQAPEISMPLIRWAQARFDAGPTDQSYWRAVDILRAVQGGGWFLVPGSNSGQDRFERYQPPYGQDLPRAEAMPVTVSGHVPGPATPAEILMSAV